MVALGKQTTVYSTNITIVLCHSLILEFAKKLKLYFTGGTQLLISLKGASGSKYSTSV